MPGEREPMGNATLITLGILGGVYLIYAIGWVIGGLRLQGRAEYLVTDVMYQGSFWLAVLAPLLWFGTRLPAHAAFQAVGAVCVAHCGRGTAAPVAVHHDRGGGTVSDTAEATDRDGPTWPVVTIAGVFGLFYAYAVWNALGNMIQAAQLLTGLNALGWFVWIFATVFPILAFAAAFVDRLQTPGASLHPRDAHRARADRGVLAQHRRVHDPQHGFSAELSGSPPAVTRIGRRGASR